MFEQLPTKSSFAGGGSRANDVKSWTEKLVLIEIVETGATIRVVFQVFDLGVEVVGKKIWEGKFFGGFVEIDDVVKLTLSVGYERKS